MSLANHKKSAERAGGSSCRFSGFRFATMLGRGHPGSRLEPPTSIRQSRLPRLSLVSNALSKTDSPVLFLSATRTTTDMIAQSKFSGKSHRARTTPARSAKQLNDKRFACAASQRQTSFSPVTVASRRPLPMFPYARHSRCSTPLCAARGRCQATFSSHNILWPIGRRNL
jgi:hypothetical protein